MIAGAETPFVPATLLMDGGRLAESRQRIRAGDPSLRPALTNLLYAAEQAMTEGPFTVMNKTLAPPSEDKHDYLSFGRYWWPDPDRPDGLPYIRRDGATNPDSQGAASDRPRLGSLCGNVETLALAHYFTGEERFAARAVLLLRTWFLHPDTRMNPNLNFAQGIPGRVAGRKTGVLDGRMFCQVLDGIALLSNSRAFGAEDEAGLRAWFVAYLDWLKTHENARGESEAKNNHGTFFDVQVVHVALFAGDRAFATSVVESAIEKRILAHIREDGSQPEELARTRTLHYSLFSLEAMFQLARLAEHVGVDLWHAGDSRIRAGLDYVAPYADPERPWPHPTIREAERVRLLPLLLHGAAAYGSEDYRRWAGKLPAEETGIHRAQLVVPLMR